MPFQNQFSLAVELTNLLPGGPVLDTAGRQLLNVVRAIQKSGSDLLVEEDLAAVFGRLRINPQFESSFRTLVKESSVRSLSGYLGIVLEGGAGPTVRRSFQSRPMMSAVIQLSLLVWVHPINSLASRLESALEGRLQGGPQEAQDVPSHADISRVLRAIREQTSQYPWQLHLNDIEARLDADQDLRAIQSPVLQGLLDFLVAVQQLPEDRTISVSSSHGVATIVLWAHKLLGLNVLVRDSRREIQFGSGRMQIMIDHRDRWGEDSIILFDATSKEELFRLSEEAPRDRLLLSCEVRYRARGYGTSMLKRDISTDSFQLLDLAHRVVAASWLESPKLSNHASANALWNTLDRGKYRPLTHCSRRSLFETATFLFDGLELEWNTAESLMDSIVFYRYCPIPKEDVIDLQFETTSQYFDDESIGDLCSRESSARHIFYHLDRNSDPKEIRRKFRQITGLVESLRTVLFTFAGIADIEACGDLPLARLTSPLKRSNYGLELCQPYDLFNRFCRLFLGSEWDESKIGKAALVSGWGWSIYLASLTARDPTCALSDRFMV